MLDSKRYLMYVDGDEVGNFSLLTSKHQSLSKIVLYDQGNSVQVMHTSWSMVAALLRAHVIVSYCNVCIRTVRPSSH